MTCRICRCIRTASSYAKLFECCKQSRDGYAHALVPGVCLPRFARFIAIHVGLSIRREDLSRPLRPLRTP